MLHDSRRRLFLFFFEKLNSIITGRIVYWLFFSCEEKKEGPEIVAAIRMNKSYMLRRGGGELFYTCSRIDGALDQMVVLVHPLSVTLEVDLRGGRRAADQRHRLVLHDVDVVGLHQEVRQQV